MPAATRRNAWPRPSPCARLSFGNNKHGVCFKFADLSRERCGTARSDAQPRSMRSRRQQMEDSMKGTVTGAACTGAACLALLTTLLAVAPATGESLEKVKVIIPQNSVFVLNWMGAKDAGVFSKHGIDIEVDARPFAGFLAGIPSKAGMVGTYSGMDGILKMNQGLDLAVVGGGLTVFQEIYVRKDSPIKTIADLRGKKFGAWSTGAGSFKAVRAALMEAHGIDVTKDVKLMQLAPPALYKMLERGDIDAMINISSFTIKAASEPDKFRSIFSANDYWKQKTGYPIVWSAPLIAWKSWVKENPKRAENMAEATEESFRWLRTPANFDAAVKAHGKLAGVTTPEAIATYKKWLGEKRIFLAKWDQKIVDAQWQFLEMAKRHGILDTVPDKKEHALILEK
jgi:ABC-type nitrate/sulfonate/bicarbonate transport system substrate-binding protein